MIRKLCTIVTKFCVFLFTENCALLFTDYNVCCAVIANGTKILAVQRGPASSHPFQWEFPGGKIHQEETAQQCIVREIEEELTIRIEVMNPLIPVEFNYGFRQIRLTGWICKIASGEIRLTEHIAQQWFRFDEWDTLDWSGADRELILKNQEFFRAIVLGKQS